VRILEFLRTSGKVSHFERYIRKWTREYGAAVRFTYRVPVRLRTSREIPQAAPSPLGIMTTLTVALVLPCLDESLAPPPFLAGLPDGYLAVVVDSGSRIDLTEIPPGDSAAVKAGVAARNADVVAVMERASSQFAVALESMVAHHPAEPHYWSLSGPR
jgi:hypothetical protein